MHLDGLGYVRQHHRFHKLFALLKECLLLFDNTAADAQQRVITALQTLNQPACFLKVAANVLIISVVTGAGAHGGVLLVDLQARNAVGVQFNDPAAIVFSHQHIGNDIFRFAGLNRLPRTRIERLDQIHRFLQHLFFQARDAHQGAEVVVRQQIQMIADDEPGFVNPRCFFSKLRKLNQKAVTQIFRGDANRVETLNAFQDGFDLFQFNLVIADAFKNLVQRHGQIARVVNGIDNRGGNGAIGIGERRQLHLPHQVVLKRLGSFALVDREFIVLVVCTRPGRGTRGVDFIPAGIQRQFVRHLFLFECIYGVERFCVLRLLGVYLVMKIGLLQQRIAVQRLLELLLEF